MTDTREQGGPEFFEGPGMDDVELRDAPGWPKVLGIASIAWGAVSLGCVGCGSVGQLMSSIFAPQMAQAFPDGMPPVMTNPPMLIWVNYAFGGVIALLLLIAGIMLVMRNWSARVMHIVYAVLAILNTSWGISLSLQYQNAVDKWCRENPGTQFAQQNAGGGAIQLVLMVVFVVLGLGWPLFCLVWFGLVKKSRESMTGGMEAAA